MALQTGIAQIAGEIERAFPAETSIALVSLESPSAKFTGYVLDELQGTLTNGKKLTVVERRNLEPLRNEINFGMTGMISDETAVSMGHWLGVEVIVTGTFTDLGSNCRLRFNAVWTETAVHERSPAVTVFWDDLITSLIPTDQQPPPAVVPAKPDPQLATRYFNAGFAHYEAKEYREAIADFNRVLQITSNDIDTLFYRSRSYDEIKGYDGAIAGYTELIRLKPDTVEAYNNRGKAYAAKGEYDRAIADYNQAIRLNPNLANAYINRGIAYQNKGDNDRAIADYNQAIRLNPNLADAYYNRGATYDDKGEYDRAIADYNQAIRLNPNDADAYINRGIAYQNKGDNDRAIADYNQAIRINPNLAGAYYNRGLAYYYKGDYTHARADWEQVLRLNPNITQARENLEVLRGMGY
jgi:tetratricopeptide (TPR) repeat protein